MKPCVNYFTCMSDVLLPKNAFSTNEKRTSHMLMCVNRIDTLVPKAKTLFCRRHPQSHSLLSRPFFSFACTVKDKTNKISFCMPSCAVAAPLTHRLIWCVVVLNRESLSSLFHVWQWLVIEAIAARVYLSVDTNSESRSTIYNTSLNDYGELIGRTAQL